MPGKTEPVYEQLLPYLLARASHIISAEFYDKLRRRGISVRRWRLLGMLWDSDGATIRELSDAILVEQSSTTRLVDRAVGDGLVVKRGHGSDKRKVTVSITEKGRSYIGDLVVEAVRVDAALAYAYDSKKAEALKAALRDLITHYTAGRETTELPSKPPE